MSVKPVGSICKRSQKSVGKLYNPSKNQSNDFATTTTFPGSGQYHPTDRQSVNRKRSNSVGRIYTRPLQDAHSVPKKAGSPKKGFHQLINYEEMESKLSSYLNCTIKTSSRQKYNYLSQHNFHPYVEPPSYQNVKHYDTDGKTASKALTVVQTNHHNIPDRERQRISKKLWGQPAKEVTMSRKIDHGTRKQSPQSRKNNKENSNSAKTKQRDAKNRREAPTSIFNIQYQQQKSQLSNKLMKIIDNYETKNKQLGDQLTKLQLKQRYDNLNPNKKTNNNGNCFIENKENQTKEQSDVFSEEELSQIYNKLVAHNLKGICLSNECDPKLDTLWKAIHSQVILDQKLRIIKLFINQENIQKVIADINYSRIKKIDSSVLKVHTEEYDPFLVEKFMELLKTPSPNLSTKKVVKWIANSLIKHYEESEHHWLKYLSQEKMECSIKSMILEKEISGLRHCDGLSKDLNLREFTRWLSTLFKGNLRNRNVFQIYSKLKGMSYVGRFIELLEQKAGKGQQLKKFTTK